MKKNFGLMFTTALILVGALFTGGCTVYDDDDADPDTTVVNPPSNDAPDVTVTPPAGGGVEIDR
jgi:hypothetical protein